MKRFLICVLSVCVFHTLLVNTAWCMSEADFRAKVTEYLEDKIKPAAFIKICTDNLATQEVLADDGYKGYVFAMRGDAYRMNRDVKKALADAQKAIEANPKTVTGYILKTETLADMDKLVEAAEAAKIAADNAQDAEQKVQLTQWSEGIRQKSTAISPTTLWKAFDENEVAAEELYKDKAVVVQGKIEAITTSATGYPQVNFSVDKYGIHKVIFEFSKDSKPQIAKLKKGQGIMLTGQCRGMIMKSVFLKKSKIVE